MGRVMRKRQFRRGDWWPSCFPRARRKKEGKGGGKKEVGKTVCHPRTDYDYSIGEGGNIK